MRLSYGQSCPEFPGSRFALDRFFQFVRRAEGSKPLDVFAHLQSDELKSFLLYGFAFVVEAACPPLYCSYRIRSSCSVPGKVPQADRAELEHFRRPTRLIPTDGIVRATATEITRDAKTDLLVQAR